MALLAYTCKKICWVQDYRPHACYESISENDIGVSDLSYLIWVAKSCSS